jgi:ankyrin repeat protein
LRNIGGRLADNISWWFVGIWQIWLTWLLLGTQVSLLCYVVTVNVSWLAGLAIALPIVAILTTLAIAVSRRYSRREKRNAVAVLADSEDEPTDADPTPLMAAIDRGAGPTEISALIAGGADVNQRNRYGMTALMWAAFDAGPDVTRTLLAAGAKVDLADEDGDTALMNAAAFNDHFEVIEMLLEAGADASTRNNDGQTALDHAKMNPDSAAEKRIVKLLRAAEASTKKKR